MKYTYIKYILGLALCGLPVIMEAQSIPEADTDSVGEGEQQVNVAFRKVATGDLLGGVSVVNAEEQQKKDHTTWSLENMSSYVGGWNGNSLWGMDGDNDGGYLVLVDGVPRDANNVLPSEIAQITFLKSAAAVVLYGSRASKGAILITTKNGRVGDLRIDVTANTGFNVAKSYPEYLGSAEYMTYYNQALANDGLSAQYSAEDIYNYGSHSNPYHYPDLNFYSSDYIRKAYNRSEVTAEISGGGRVASYYANINYYHTNDVFKFGEAKKNGVNRLGFRGNVDIRISDAITAFAHTTATFYDSRSAKGNYWSTAATLRPNRVSPLVPLSYIDPNAASAQELVNNSNNLIDGQYFLSGTQLESSNIFADYYSAGYSKYTSRQFQFDTGINIDLNKLLKGLTFKTQFAIDYATSYNTSFNNTYAIYTPTWSNYGGKDVIVALTKEGEDKKSGVQNVSGSTDNQTIMFTAQFDYRRAFNGVHNVNATLLANGWQKTLSGEYHRKSNANLGLQLSYNYAHRYYADFAAAAIHSAKLAEGKREAISPSLTLGWRLSEESFLKNSTIVDDLMLSVSGGIISQDLDISDYYMYAGNYRTSGWFSWNSGGYEAFNPEHGANEDLGFVKRKEFSVNLRGSFLKKMITADFNFFVTNTEGLLINNSTMYPSYFYTVYYPDATFVPWINYNNNRRTGFDFALNFQKTFGKVETKLGVTGTYYTTKATKRDENYADSYQNRTGKAIDGIWGYKSAGLFQSQEDIDNWPEQQLGSTVKPGDIKYIDMNDDGVIDSKDQVFLGKGGWYGAPFTMGVNLTLKWKGFTFFALGTANLGAYGVKNSSYYWCYGENKYSKVVRNAWTEETAATATYPRLTTGTGSNNFCTSDYWLYKTDAFRLAKVQVTYDLPKSIFGNSFIQGASVYLSGTNLLTLSLEREVLELNVGSAPQTRFYNLGVKLNF